MTIQMKMLGFGAGLAAFAAAAPASAQYAYPGYNYGYGYNNYYNNASQYAANRCTAEVNARLYNRTGIGGPIGSGTSVAYRPFPFPFPFPFVPAAGTRPRRSGAWEEGVRSGRRDSSGMGEIMSTPPADGDGAALDTSAEV